MHSYILARADNSTTPQEIKRNWKSWVNSESYIDIDIEKALNAENIYVQNRNAKEAVIDILADALDK